MGVYADQPNGGIAAIHDLEWDTDYIQATVYLEPWEDPAEATADFTHFYAPDRLDELKRYVDGTEYGGTIHRLERYDGIAGVTETAELYHTTGTG